MSQQWDGQVLVLTGPRSVTYREIAAALSRDLGVLVPCRDITPADIGVQMTARGLPKWEAEHFEEMYAMFRRGESEFVSDDVPRLSGREPRTVETYLAEEASPWIRARSTSRRQATAWYRMVMNRVSSSRSNCLICEQENADGSMSIFSDDDDGGWAAGIVPGYDVPGWFVLRVPRHAEGLEGLTAGELALRRAGP